MSKGSRQRAAAAAEAAESLNRPALIYASPHHQVYSDGGLARSLRFQLWREASVTIAAFRVGGAL